MVLADHRLVRVSRMVLADHRLVRVSRMALADHRLARVSRMARVVPPMVYPAAPVAMAPTSPGSMGSSAVGTGVPT